MSPLDTKGTLPLGGGKGPTVSSASWESACSMTTFRDWLFSCMVSIMMYGWQTTRTQKWSICCNIQNINIFRLFYSFVDRASDWEHNMHIRVGCCGGGGTECEWEGSESSVMVCIRELWWKMCTMYVLWMNLLRWSRLWNVEEFMYGTWKEWLFSGFTVLKVSGEMSTKIFVWWDWF